MNRSVHFQDQSRIERISQQLEPDEVEEDYFRKVQAGQVSNSDLQSGLDEGEEYEDDEDDDSEEDDEDENALHTDQVSKTVVVRNVEALSDFPGEQQEDLPFKKGEVLIVIDPREDGWWIAENSVGKRGVIPKTLVKIVGNEDKERQKKELAHDQENDQVGDLPPSPTRSGKQLWNSLKKGSKQETSVTDVLKVMGAMPSGFKSTTLGRLAKEERFMVSSWVVPKLRASHLGFRDLVWDPVNKQIAPWPVKVNRVFTVVVARKIPLPGTGVQVLCRHVRIALWDWRRKQILSNVHTVRATTTEKDPLTWSFTAKAATSMYDGEGLARLNTTEDTVALLFELGILYLRTSTGERSEVSCGWCILKLFEETGTPIPNKTFELLVHGGTPYDENLTDLDHTLSVQENTNLFQSIVRTNNQPRLFIKLTSSNKASKDVQDNLPATLLTCNQYVPFIAHYRQLVGVTLLDGTRDTFDGELLTDPVIAFVVSSSLLSCLVELLTDPVIAPVVSSLLLSRLVELLTDPVIAFVVSSSLLSCLVELLTDPVIAPVVSSLLLSRLVELLTDPVIAFVVSSSLLSRLVELLTDPVIASVVSSLLLSCLVELLTDPVIAFLVSSSLLSCLEELLTDPVIASVVSSLLLSCLVELLTDPVIAFVVSSSLLSCLVELLTDPVIASVVSSLLLSRLVELLRIR
ncbi:nephrocystin-1 isoform X2 [Nematostella vectensis]|uniref:nephrocystin-1 isoform X2 n=1 Tax=Nematostella vectensis TaxID=45351 RepID=UPI0020772F2E|nr:nephrocystin-1 isoform X2 [Nematostella vectensis]